MFLFAEDEVVALREDYPALGLKAGDTGKIWVMYDTTPPAYDVTFGIADGREFDMVVEENEIMAVPSRRELVNSG